MNLNSIFQLSKSSSGTRAVGMLRSCASSSGTFEARRSEGKAKVIAKLIVLINDLKGMAETLTPDLIAPCGMNCGICKAYLAYSRGVPYKKGEVTHCTGCLVRNKKCAFIRRDCEKLRKNQVRFCHECASMPCKQLAKLDAHYRARYGMSMIENLKMIRKKGMDEFLKSQSEKYRCTSCGDIISVHDGKCYACGHQAEKPKGSNPNLRWLPNRKSSKRSSSAISLR